MYLFGHIGFTLLIHKIFSKEKFPISIRHRFLIALGSMLPDFLDKPIGSLFFGTGRWLGHSLSFQLLIFILFTTITRIESFPLSKFDIKILYIGSLLHLIEDMPGGISHVVLLWPFFGAFPLGNQGDFLHGFESPLTILTEIIGILIVLFLYHQEDWGSKARIIIILTIFTYILLFLIVYSILLGF